MGPQSTVIENLKLTLPAASGRWPRGARAERAATPRALLDAWASLASRSQTLNSATKLLKREARATRGFCARLTGIEYFRDSDSEHAAADELYCVQFAPTTPCPLAHATGTLTGPGLTRLARFRAPTDDFLQLAALGERRRHFRCSSVCQRALDARERRDLR